MSAPAAIVTGWGTVSPFGVGRAALAEALWRGATAFAARTFTTEHDLPPIELWSASIPAFDPAAILGKKGLRGMSREALLWAVAAADALDDAALAAGGVDPEAAGVVVGSARPGLDDYLGFHLDAQVWGPDRVRPVQGPNTGLNAAASHATIRLGWRAVNTTLCAGLCSGLDAVAHAAGLIHEGAAEVILAGGVDALGYFSARQLKAEGSWSHRAPRPYDRRRDGAVPGEGAVALVLESERHAAARGARIRGRLTAFEQGFHLGLGEAAARLAGWLGRTRATAAIGSASGDRLLDAAEGRACAAAPGLPVAAVKGAAGEWHGGSGALQLATALEAIERRALPPTAALEELDPELPLSASPAPREIDPARIALPAIDPAGHLSFMIAGPP